MTPTDSRGTASSGPPSQPVLKGLPHETLSSLPTGSTRRPHRDTPGPREPGRMERRGVSGTEMASQGMEKARAGEGVGAGEQGNEGCAKGPEQGASQSIGESPPREASSATWGRAGAAPRANAGRAPPLTKEGLLRARESAAARRPGLAGSPSVCSCPVANRLQREREGRGSEGVLACQHCPSHPFCPVSCAPQTAPRAK